MSTQRSSVVLGLHGQVLPPSTRPDILQRGLRTAGPTRQHADVDRVLPTDLVQVDEVLDVSATARSTDAGRGEHSLQLAGDQVLLLEMADGTTLILNPEQFAAMLARLDPSAIDATTGQLHLGAALAARGAASQGRFVGDIGQGLEGILSRVFKLTLKRAKDDLLDQAVARAGQELGQKRKPALKGVAELGLSWYGTKALMALIEKQVSTRDGLCRWTEGGLAGPLEASDPQLLKDASEGPLLVFIHGTGSSTLGSFADLREGVSAVRTLIDERYGERVYALEHRTLSQSPIDNALQLARALPANGRVHLVTHSRGGLVGDLLCLDDISGLIESFGQAQDKVLVAAEDEGERERIVLEVHSGYADQRAALKALDAELRARQIVVERYVRVACPSAGTTLASGNFDLFLSVLLKLIGLVPVLQAQPLYALFQRVVLEIARNRMRPNLVPGIEAMLPESALARFLRIARPKQSVQLGVIAGDLEGDGLRWLVALFVDWTLFSRRANDLVVDTESMIEGIARQARGQVLETALDESHFGYFRNADARNAMCAWLDPDGSIKASFRPVSSFGRERTLQEDIAAAQREVIGSRSSTPPSERPLVVVLPGVMGTHLLDAKRNRIWCDPLDLVAGGLRKLAWDRPNVEAEKLLDMSYKDLCRHLRQTHDVRTFPYDWRQPLDVLAQRFRGFLQALLAEADDQRPVRILAHSMGGLVVRATIHADPALWDRAMERAGARFVMLGTPNQGSYAMVENLLGKASMIRMLARADLKHDLQEILDLIGGFRGALQLLPRPGFVDADGQAASDYFHSARWQQLKHEIDDRWFGKGACAVPQDEALIQAQWLWQQDGDRPGLPEKHQDKVTYVFGCAERTPCGLKKDGKHWKMLGTAEGDGTVTWKSGDIAGIGQRCYMPTGHGDLANDEDYFDSLVTLLETGLPGRLSAQPPARRGDRDRVALPYDAGPVPYPTEEDLLGGLFGAPRKRRTQRRAEPSLKIRVTAMNLRSVTQPILVGHFEDDPIAGAEKVVDQYLVDGELSMRNSLGLYAGKLGTASAVLTAPHVLDPSQGNYTGAVAAGLGRFDGSLSITELTQAVRAGALRYLLHLQEMRQAAGVADAGEVTSLASVLIGFNSSVNLSLMDSVSALIRGVCEANRQFAARTGSSTRIGSLEIVELYLDTAISAAHALRRVAQSLNETGKLGTRIDAAQTLRHGEGYRHRLADLSSSSYWPRLIVTDAAAERPDDGSEIDAAQPPRLRPRPAIAEKLRFLLLGQRARAETVLQHRQPGLVESLVSREIDNPVYDPAFCRTLFQLMVPPNVKEAARQLRQLVLVLDRYTADLPWELMQADDQPLVTQVAVIRQLSTGQYRQQVSQAQSRSAYVLGNPSTEGFGGVFVDSYDKPYPDPASLPGAEQEARRVTEVLSLHGFAVQAAIGAGTRALDAITPLYQRPYRILHIAAHGIHDELGKDGHRRSGVVLSDGQLITAAEVRAMETVPELVFLNCCHLGRTGTADGAMHTDFNRLAYSLARELIETGVRAVIAAGWAVGDLSGEFFAQSFYETLLGQRESFGEAVFRARKATFEAYPQDITWGAYQAYGDPAWSIDPRHLVEDFSPPQAFAPVSPDELIALIEDLRYDVRRRTTALSAADSRRIHKRVASLLQIARGVASNAQDGDWTEVSAVRRTLAELYSALGPEYASTALSYQSEHSAQQGLAAGKQSRTAAKSGHLARTKPAPAPKRRSAALASATPRESETPPPKPPRKRSTKTKTKGR